MKCLSSLMTVLILASLLPLGVQEKSKSEKSKKDEKRPPLSVKLNVGVTDANGQPINDVTEDRFRIFEDEAPQTITSFQFAGRPSGFVLAIDASGSLRSMFSTVLATAKLIVKNKAPDEQILLMRFISSDKITKVRDFTSDQATLLNAIDSLYLEGGQSAIIDAIAVANDSIAEFTKGKGNVHRPLIIVTDGEDRLSYFSEPQLIEKLAKTGAEVHSLAFQQTLQSQAVRDKAANFLNRIALSSGGGVYYPKSVSELEGDVRQMMSATRSAYVIGYEPTNAARDGKFRKVRIEIESAAGGPKLSAFARDGYVAPKN